ncbi:mitochondrial carrier domain-containing protein [Cyathus striatus]|nr:mitochondrial carrier domain-containing protein [Cyathus striatus]
MINADTLCQLLMPTEHTKPTHIDLSLGISRNDCSGYHLPLDLIRTRMAYHTDTSTLLSFVNPVRQIYTETPASTRQKSMLTRYPGPNFYRGFTVTTLGIIPYAGVLFLTWEYLRSLLPQEENLAIGAVSGALAQMACYPFGVVRRRMQVGGVSTPERLIGWKEAVRSVWRGKGWRGFYVGLGVGALSFAVWQWAKRGLGVLFMDLNGRGG